MKIVSTFFWVFAFCKSKTICFTSHILVSVVRTLNLSRRYTYVLCEKSCFYGGKVGSNHAILRPKTYEIANVLISCRSNFAKRALSTKRVC